MKKSIKLKSGERFGKLTVITLDHIQKYVSPSGQKHNHEHYLCKCSCGGDSVVRKNNLLSGYIQSCGCLLGRIIKHGLKGTRMYGIYAGMKDRCLNSNNKNYHNYGGRGINICDQWKNDIKAFYDWSMVNGYRNDLSIDRIDNDKGYSPRNCRWATPKEQMRNTRKNSIVKYKGKTRCLAEWSDILTMKPSTLYNRINKYNWSIDRAFETPEKGGKNGKKF